MEIDFEEITKHQSDPVQRLARARTVAPHGIDGFLVDVECYIVNALRRFSLIGLPDSAVRESKDRVRCAIQKSGFKFPHHEVIVSLAPASKKKAGTGFDLAVALSILCASGELEQAELDGEILLAELALDGSLKPTAHVLAASAFAASRNMEIILPSSQIELASIVPNSRVIGASSLLEVIGHLKKISPIKAAKRPNIIETPSTSSLTMDDVVGHELAKRSFEIAAAGKHNLFMTGPPGAGKSMLAARLPSLLPRLSDNDALEVAKISHAFDPNMQKQLPSSPPFRSPHHTTSTPGLIGGGTSPSPGEISLSHRGVLFLDELPEFQRSSLEALRTILEERKVTISRARGRVTFPANFLLVTAMNPCPCGYYLLANASCRCSSTAIAKYHQKISGPLLDRFDIHLWLEPVDINGSQKKATNSAQDMAKRVKEARARQLERQQCLNSELPAKFILKQPMDIDAQNLLQRFSKQRRMSARATSGTIKLALTISDLEHSSTIKSQHMQEALSLRAPQSLEG